MMKAILSTALLAAIGLTMAAAPLSAADRMQTGEWEFTSSTKGEANTFKRCITPADTGSVNGNTKSARAFAEKQAGGQCKITDYRAEGNTVSYSMVCGSRTIRSTATYHGDRFEGDVAMTANGAAEIVSHVTARRLGACP